MRTIRSKFYTTHVEKFNTGEFVNLSAVVSGSEENKSFSEATPSGNLAMSITNPDALGFFEEGKEYYLDITPAVPQEAEAAPETEAAQ